MSIELINPSVRFVDKVNGFQIMSKLEKCARTCYQSNDKQHTKSTADFLRGIIKSGHTSVLEHESITVDVITSRDVLCEWTRHRIGVGYSVESTRYVNYEKGAQFIIPPEYDVNMKDNASDELVTRVQIFREACETSAYAYAQMIKHGAKPQEARAVLPQALKVNMKVTMNIRAWRHFLELRCSPSAHPNIREIAIAILLYFRKKMLPLFEDIRYDEAFYQNHKKRIDAIVEESMRMITLNELEEKVAKAAHEKEHEACQKKIENRCHNKYDLIYDLMKDIGREYGEELKKHREEIKQKDEKERIDKMTASMKIDEEEDNKKSVNEAFDELGEVFEKYEKKVREPLDDHKPQPKTRQEVENEKLVKDIERLMKKFLDDKTDIHIIFDDTLDEFRKFLS